MSKIAVIFGGPSPEHDISILTGLQASRELTSSGHEVTALFWSKAGDWYQVSSTLEGSAFIEGIPRDAQPMQFVVGHGGGFVPTKKSLFGKWSTGTGTGSMLAIDVAVVCCHGGPGEDGTLQGALDLAGIAYTGPDVAGAALSMDKLAFAGVVAAAGFPTLPRVGLTQYTKEIGFDGPYIVKPRFGGSSLGVEVVDSLETAKALLHASPFMRDGAVIEPYKPNSYDLNLGVRLFPEAQVSAIEKPLRTSGPSAAILGYSDKYIGGEGMVSAPRELPADIGADTTETIRSMAVQIATLVGVRGVQRIDFLADGDEIYVNEINTIPGSLAKHLWVDPVVPFNQLLEGMLQEATKIRSTNWTTSGADGSALRSAGSIAGKLS